MIRELLNRLSNEVPCLAQQYNQPDSRTSVENENNGLNSKMRSSIVFFNLKQYTFTLIFYVHDYCKFSEMVQIMLHFLCKSCR